MALLLAMIFTQSLPANGWSSCSFCQLTAQFDVINQPDRGADWFVGLNIGWLHSAGRQPALFPADRQYVINMYKLRCVFVCVHMYVHYSVCVAVQQINRISAASVHLCIETIVLSYSLSCLYLFMSVSYSISHILSFTHKTHSHLCTQTRIQFLPTKFCPDNRKQAWNLQRDSQVARSSLQLNVLRCCHSLEGKHAQTSFKARVHACMCSSSSVNIDQKLISLQPWLRCCRLGNRSLSSEIITDVIILINTTVIIFSCEDCLLSCI